MLFGNEVVKTCGRTSRFASSRLILERNDRISRKDCGATSVVK
jgi:hypothetical protein